MSDFTPAQSNVQTCISDTVMAVKQQTEMMLVCAGACVYVCVCVCKTVVYGVPVW